MSDTQSVRYGSVDTRAGVKFEFQSIRTNQRGIYIYKVVAKHHPGIKAGSVFIGWEEIILLVVDPYEPLSTMTLAVLDANNVNYEVV